MDGEAVIGWPMYAAVYAAVWFVVSLWFARTWVDTNRCPSSCRTVDHSDYRRIYHAEECRAAQHAGTLKIEPGFACFAAAFWPITLPYRIVAWAQDWHPLAHKAVDHAEIERMERELGIGGDA